MECQCSFGIKRCIPEKRIFYKPKIHFFVAIATDGKGILSIKPEDVHSNIIIVQITKPGLTAQEFCDRLFQVTFSFSSIFNVV